MNTKDICAKYGIRANISGGTINIFAPNAHAVFAVYAEGEKTPVKDIPIELKPNHNVLIKDGGYSSADFYEKTPAEFVKIGQGSFDTSEFLAARERLQRGLKFMDTLSANISKKRSRFLSEHDGEYDMDRRFELKPFFSTTITNNGVAQTCRIDINFSFICDVSSRSISQYGAVAWSIVDFLERGGIQCEVNLLYRSNCSGHCSGGLSMRELTVRLKDAGQYVDPLDMARCFTAAFYRRGLFWLAAIGHALAGGELYTSIGSSHEHKTSATTGVLQLGADRHTGQFAGHDKLETLIKTALAMECA